MRDRQCGKPEFRKGVNCMEFFLLGLLVSVTLTNHLLFKKRLTSFTLIMGPYIVIALLNNFVAVNFGFYRITHNTLFMVLIGCFTFFVGNCVVYAASSGKKLVIRDTIPGGREDILSVPRIKWYVSAVLAVRILQLALLFMKNGLEAMIINDFELMLTRGAMGHLMISVFPLIPVLFYNWVLDRKDLYSLLLTAIYFILAFVETEKAQVLTITIAVFLYCAFKNRKNLYKGGVIVAAMITLLFIGNYASKFILQGYFDKIGAEYYTYRLWNYIAGSLINSRAVTDMFAAIRVNGFDYLADVLLALPNLFIKGLTGMEIGPDVRVEIPYIRDFMNVTIFETGRKAQKGNVISTMTYIFGNGNWAAFVLVMIFWGIISEYILVRMYTDGRDASLMGCCCYMAFSMVSFFGTYYTSASFTERLIYCLIWAVLFSKKRRFKFSGGSS